MSSGYRLLRLLAGLIFPEACPGCDRALAPDAELWCPACTRELLKATGAEYCPRCGLTASPYLVDAEGCRSCRDQPRVLDGMARVGLYSTLVGDMVKKYKYGRRQRLDGALGSLLADAIQGRPWAGEIDALVPVPTTRQSQLQYRFRPVDLIAARVGRVLSLPVLPLVYVRGKARKQVDLPATERAGNVRGVFHVSRHACLNGASLCVVDDVSTSGATLREIARVLKRAGAARVYGATLAKTDPHEAQRQNA